MRELRDPITTLMSEYYTPDEVRARAAVDQLRLWPRDLTWGTLECMLIADDLDTRSTAALALRLIDADRSLSSAQSLLFDEDHPGRLYICNRQRAHT